MSCGESRPIDATGQTAASADVKCLCGLFSQQGREISLLFEAVCNGKGVLLVAASSGVVLRDNFRFAMVSDDTWPSGKHWCVFLTPRCYGEESTWLLSIPTLRAVIGDSSFAISGGRTTCFEHCDRRPSAALETCSSEPLVGIGPPGACSWKRRVWICTLQDRDPVGPASVSGTLDVRKGGSWGVAPRAWYCLCD